MTPRQVAPRIACAVWLLSYGKLELTYTIWLVQTTYQQLIERVEKTVDALKTAKAENFVGKEDAEVIMFNGKVKFTGLTYLQAFGLPNFFFHVTTAYDILRKEGVPVGKLDFLGRSM